MTTELMPQIDKYNIIENLGKGAKSTIWKAQDSATGKVYTLKRVIKESDKDDRFLEQTETEYHISSKFTHPYLRKSFDLIRIRKWLKTQELLLIMEYIEGSTLKQSKLTDIEEIIDVFIKVAQGLDELHGMGYLHTDIKPKNILVIPHNGIKIIDFGQSCPIGHRKKRIQGTPDFMAPEQVERGILDQRTDVFNLGASLYWVLTNQNFPTTMPKHHSSSDINIPQRVEDIPRPDHINPEVPTVLSKLVMDCCNYNINERPENMREVIARLEVANHLYYKQKHPHQTQDETAKSEDTIAGVNIAPDDSDDFDKFIDTIL